jgi:hypothetical protein
MGGDLFTSFLIAFLVVTVVMLLLREVYCWYWKINRIVDLLEGIRGDLSTLQTAGGMVSPRSADEQLRLRSESVAAARHTMAAMPGAGQE